MTTSPELVSVLLQLRPVAPLTLPRSHGHMAFKAALDLFTHLEPHLSHSLHEAEGRKPFTVSPLMAQALPKAHEINLDPAKTYGWRLTGLSSEISQLLLGLSDSNTVRGVRMHQAVFTLDSVSVQKTARYDSLAEKWLAREQPLQALLHFLTPTTFRLGTYEQPFPLPQWVFGSLLGSWEAHAPSALQGFDPAQVGLTRWDGKTHRVELGSKLGGTVGFTGQFRYQALPDSPLMHGQVGLLAAYAEFAGVGWLTTNGLGQVVPELPE